MTIFYLFLHSQKKKLCRFVNANRVTVLKFQMFFFFTDLNKMLVIRTGIHQMLVRIGNREDPDQTASSEAVRSGSAVFV